MVEFWSPKPAAVVRVHVDPRATKTTWIGCFCFASEGHEGENRAATKSAGEAEDRGEWMSME